MRVRVITCAVCARIQGKNTKNSARPSFWPFKNFKTSRSTRSTARFRAHRGSPSDWIPGTLEDGSSGGGFGLVLPLQSLSTAAACLGRRAQGSTSRRSARLRDLFGGVADRQGQVWSTIRLVAQTSHLRRSKRTPLSSCRSRILQKFRRG